MPRNRNLNEHNFHGIRSDMTKGNFKQTGDTIKFDWFDCLQDGQHRLQGIVASGQTHKLLVVRGLDPEAFPYMDIGRNRNAADVLSIEGIESASKIAAMAKFLIHYRRGKLITMAQGGQKDKKYRLTNSDVLDFVQENLESLKESYPYGYGANNRDKVLSGSHMAALHYIFKTIKPDCDVLADDFFHKLGIGADLAKDSPIYLLRTRLIQDLRSKRKMPPLEKIALVIKAWNAYREEKKPKVITWSNVQEPFPKPR